MLPYKLSQLTRWMVPAFNFVSRERKYTSPVMLQTNRQIFFILALSLRACCFYHTWQQCAILGRGLVGQIDNGLQEWDGWAGDGSVSACALNIEQSLLWDRAETCSDVFSFPMGSFHILPFLVTNQTGCSSHSQSAWQMGSRVKTTKKISFFSSYSSRFDFDMQRSSVSLTPDFLFDFSSVSKFKHILPSESNVKFIKSSLHQADNKDNI